MQCEKCGDEINKENSCCDDKKICSKCCECDKTDCKEENEESCCGGCDCGN